MGVGLWVGVAGAPGEGTTLIKCTPGMEWPRSCQEEPQRSPLAALASAKAATATGGDPERIPGGLQSKLLLRVGHSSTSQSNPTNVPGQTLLTSLQQGGSPQE